MHLLIAFIEDLLSRCFQGSAVIYSRQLCKKGINLIVVCFGTIEKGCSPHEASLQVDMTFKRGFGDTSEIVYRNG